MANGKFIFKATLTIAFFILMSRIPGLVRESVIAGLLGPVIWLMLTRCP
ncbi:MAG: hypothetical protein RQM92_16435 [Candidatus Syntrophopropionicum ammoniitolerans]